MPTHPYLSIITRRGTAVAGRVTEGTSRDGRLDLTAPFVIRDSAAGHLVRVSNPAECSIEVLDWRAVA